MLHYFYHLEYPEVRAPEENTGADSTPTSQVESPTTVSSTEPTKSRNGSLDGAVQAQPTPTNGQPQQQRVMEYSIEKEQFIDPTAVATNTGETSSETGVKPKKKKKKSRMNAQTESPESPTNNSNTGGPAPAPAPTTTAQTQTETKATPNTAVVARTHRPTLTVDARVYAVARKYGVPGLAAQAAGRFERGVAAHWDTPDFLRAAREAYTSTERADRRLRDAVLAAVHAHPHLLARPDVQDVVRGLELSFDLLMHLRGDAAGASAGAGAGACAGQRATLNGGVSLTS